MSYYQPNDNKFIKSILIIPQCQQNLPYFSLKYKNTIIIDLYKDIQKNIIPILQNIAKILQIKKYNKMNKQELIDVINNHILFQ